MSSRDLLHNENGVALLIALTAIGFLTVMTIMQLNDVDRQVEDASRMQQSVILDGAIDAGLSVVQAAILADGKENEHDSEHDAWAVIESETLSAQLLDTTLSVQVEDLTGRLQVNALLQETTAGEGEGEDSAASGSQEQLWKRFLLSGRFAVEDETQVEELLDAIRDWLDADDETRTYGAETSYYQSLNPGYASRNGPLRTVEELLYVKGVTPELFFGDEEHEGIGKYLTVVVGDGKVNINTAPLPVLLALGPDLDEDAAEEMIAYREEEDNAEALADAGWYRELSGAAGGVSIDEGIISVSAAGFEVNITARTGEMEKTVQGVIVREKNGGQSLVQWRFR